MAHLLLRELTLLPVKMRRMACSFLNGRVAEARRTFLPNRLEYHELGLHERMSWPHRRVGETCVMDNLAFGRAGGIPAANLAPARGERCSPGTGLSRQRALRPSSRTRSPPCNPIGADD